MRVPVFTCARHGRRARLRAPWRLLRLPAAAALLAAAVSGAALPAAPAAQAAPTAAQARAASAGSRPPAADAETLAAQQARRTGKPVTVTSLITPTSTTQALPDGQFKLTTTARPVRAWTRSGWQPLNAALRRNHDGTWSPAVTSSPVAVSGGGTGPMAVMTAPGHALGLYWPGRLPRPVIAGDTAVYPSVLPGVDLRLTVDGEGGVRDVLVIADRAAAANPALRRLSLTAQTTGGLRLTAGPAGTLQASAGKSGAPAFTSPAPLMWDSATDAAPGQSRGTALRPVLAPAAAAAAPAASGPTRPGRHAHAAWVKTALSAPQSPRAGTERQTLALIPDAGLLASPATVFPAYIDPSWLPSGASRGWYASDADAYPGTNYYDNTADPSSPGYLQVGYNGSFNAHTFVDMKTNSTQLKNAVINSAVIQFTEETSWSCTASPVELWWTGAYHTVNSKPWVSWNNEPSWNKWSGSGSLSDGAITSQTVAHGYSGCPAAAVKFTITAFMQAKGPSGPSNIAFGLRAPSLGNTSQWKEFSNASGAITMTTYYDHRPNPQAGSSISPGGACQSLSPAKTLVGNDDFTLQTTPSDPDGGSLTVHFVLEAYGSTTALVNTAVSATSAKPARISIPRTTAQSWHSDGAATSYMYSWYTYDTDGLLDNTGDAGIGSKSKPCLFTYDPSAPQAPGLAPAPASAGSTDGAVGTLGGTADFAFGNCTTSLDSPPAACSGTTPTQYKYQIDDEAAHTITVTGTTQTVTIPLTRVGVNSIAVTSLSAGGNASAATSATYDVDPPATPYTDGDYAGTGHPDLLTVGDGTGSADKPGLWLAETDGAGHLSTPVDIGARGTGLNTYGSPADWAGAQVLHGDFTGNHVQDIVAYIPSSGTLQMIGGPGTGASLDPESGNVATLPGDVFPLGDLFLNGGNDNPADLAAAGNASLQNTGISDLVGILGDPADGYELNIYTATPGGAFENGYNIQASTGPGNGPDGAPWGPDWALQVAQPGGQAVLFALDRANGQLWESVNPGQSPSTPIGMPGSTWTQVTGGPWTANSGPVLAQADINTAGNIELWTTSGGTATSWTLPPPAASSGDTTIPLTKAAVSTLANPSHEWPLSDGPEEAAAGTGILTDTETDTGNATPTSTITYSGSGSDNDTDPVLGPVAQLDGTEQDSLTLPAGILQDTTAAHGALQSMTLSMRFRVQPGAIGILAGTSTSTLSAPSARSAPIIYLGTDGHLYGQFPSAHINTSTGVVAPDITPMESAGPVDDGLWHTVTLVADGTTHDQVLYLDNDMPIHLPNNGYVDSATPATIINPGQSTNSQGYGTDQVTIGAGIFSPAAWINSDATNGSKGTTRPSYFTGDISDIAFYPRSLAQGQFPHNTPAAVSGIVNSGVAATSCIDNPGGTPTSPGSLTDGNKIQLWNCNGYPSQNWTFRPNGTITLTAAPGYCLDNTRSVNANGNPVQLYTCNGAVGQQWQVLSDGSVMNPATGKCLDDPGNATDNGTKLDIYECSGTSNQAWSSLVRPAETAPTGTIVSLQSGLCADNTGGSSTSAGPATDGNLIQVYTCNGWPSQQWTFQPNGTITISGMCLDNQSGVAASGNPIELWTCNGRGTQQWAHPDTGAIYNPSTGMCIDGGANTSGTKLQLWTCNQTKDQVWIYPSTYNH